MSKKSSNFKRKLKSLKVGFQYFRIWGSPIKEYNRQFFESKYGSNPDHALFDFNGQLIHLYLEKGFLGYGCSSDKLELFWSCPGRSSLNGSLTSSCYFRTKAQALRELQMYSSGCKTDGLPEMIDYHAEIDSMDMFGDYNDYIMSL